eukprot:scpid54647/ scgid34254/ 
MQPCMKPNATNTSYHDQVDILREDELFFLIGCGDTPGHIQVNGSATSVRSAIYQVSSLEASSTEMEDWLSGHKDVWTKVWLCANHTSQQDSEGVHYTELELTVSRACLSVALSLVTLCLAFHIALPELRRNASGVIFMHQSAALWMAILLDLANIIVGNERTLFSCVFINVLLSFFVKSVLLLAVVQALHLHRHIFDGHKSPISHYVRKATLAAYGTSGLITLLTRLALGFDLGTPDHPGPAMPSRCQKELALGDILSATIPFLFSMLTCGVIFARIMHRARAQASRKQPAQDVGFLHHVHQARVAGSTFFLVGLAWSVIFVLFFLTIAQANLLFMSLISIMGVATFLLKILLDTAFHLALRKRYARWHTANVSILERRPPPAACCSTPVNNSTVTNGSADA